jgi:hypothetical protein
MTSKIRLSLMPDRKNNQENTCNPVMSGVIFAAFAPCGRSAFQPFHFTGHVMNAYRLIASMPNTSPEKRDAGLRAPRLHPVSKDFAHSID